MDWWMFSQEILLHLQHFEIRWGVCLGHPSMEAKVSGFKDPMYKRVFVWWATRPAATVCRLNHVIFDILHGYYISETVRRLSLLTFQMTDL